MKRIVTGTVPVIEENGTKTGTYNLTMLSSLHLSWTLADNDRVNSQYILNITFQTSFTKFYLNYDILQRGPTISCEVLGKSCIISVLLVEVECQSHKLTRMIGKTSISFEGRTTTNSASLAIIHWLVMICCGSPSSAYHSFSNH